MSTGAPDRTPEEEDAPPERLEEEDAQRYPAHEDPEQVSIPTRTLEASIRDRA